MQPGAGLHPLLVGDHALDLRLVGRGDQGGHIELAFPLAVLRSQDVAGEGVRALHLARARLLEALLRARVRFQFRHCETSGAKAPNRFCADGTDGTTEVVPCYKPRSCPVTNRGRALLQTAVVPCYRPTSA